MLDGGRIALCLQGPGSIPWKFADVDVLSTALINSFPEKALNIVMNQNFAGTAELIRLGEHALARPSYRELKANFLLLRPVVERHPDKAPFGLHLPVVSAHVSKLYTKYRMAHCIRSHRHCTSRTSSC